MRQYCNRCKTTKPIEDFNHGQRYCRVCSNEYMRNWHRARAKPKQYKPIPRQGHKICTHCAEEKPIDLFPKGKSSWCLDCKRAADREYYRRNAEEIKNNVARWQKNNPDKVSRQLRNDYKRNKDKISARNKKWRSENPDKRKVEDWRRRASKKNSPGNGIDTGDWERIKEEYCFSCAYCGKREPDVKLTLDHVIPLNKGGEHDISNAVPACPSCNSSKIDKTLIYWMYTRANYE